MGNLSDIFRHLIFPWYSNHKKIRFQWWFLSTLNDQQQCGSFIAVTSLWFISLETPSYMEIYTNLNINVTSDLTQSLHRSKPLPNLIFCACWAGWGWGGGQSRSLILNSYLIPYTCILIERLILIFYSSFLRHHSIHQCAKHFIYMEHIKLFVHLALHSRWN